MEICNDSKRSRIYTSREADKRSKFGISRCFSINYEGLIDTLSLPDKDDRHVLAAAIKVNANIIVTNNLKDFPDDYLDSFGLKAVCADDFLTDIIDLNPKIALQAFKDLVLNRKNPAMDEFQVLESFRKNGLNQTADYLHGLL